MSKVNQNMVAGIISDDLDPNGVYTFTVKMPLVFPVYEHMGSVSSPVRTLDTHGNETLAGDLSLGGYEIAHPDEDTFEIRVRTWA